MPRFRRRLRSEAPGLIEAVQWTGDNTAEIVSFIDRPEYRFEEGVEEGGERWLHVSSPGEEQALALRPGHWLVRFADNRLDVLELDELTEQYEPYE
jgi:hypothetical protein